MRRGAVAVLEATGVMLASTLFFPGVLVRVASQLLVASTSGMGISHSSFPYQLGGEVEHESGPAAWPKLFVATIAGPVLIGSVLLFPSVVKWTLLDVRPFVSVSADPSAVIGQQTPLTPFIETLHRFGFVGFLRLWFGISCFYCCVPSMAIVRGTAAELRTRPNWSPIRLALRPTIGFVRALRALDTLLLFGAAGAYLASGLIVLLIGWRALALIAQLALG